MRIIVSVFAILTSVTVAFSQSLSDLDKNPSFKGIAIGSPISKYSSILKYRNTSDGMTVYTITDKQYYSLFNITVDNAAVIAKDGVVNAVYLRKSFPESRNDLSELKLLESIAFGLKSKYGGYNVDHTNTSKTPAIFGMGWMARNVMIQIGFIDEEIPILEYTLSKRDDDY